MDVHRIEVPGGVETASLTTIVESTGDVVVSWVVALERSEGAT